MSLRAWAATRRSFGFDVLVSAIAIALGADLRMGSHWGLVDWPYLHQASAVVAGTLLLNRRRAPFGSGVAICAVSLVHPTQALFFAAYAAGAYVEDRRRAGALITALVLTAAQPWHHSAPPDIIGSAGLALVPALLGLYVAARRRLRLDRADRAERERELLFEQVRMRERARIAGEMHDVITHRVSLMVLQAGALRTRARDEDVRARAEELRLVGCKALEELRGLVAVTRSEQQVGSVVAAPRAVLDVSDLVADSRSAGVSVEVITLGEPHATSPVVGRAAYRVVQEALTNVHKHAPGALVDVRLHYVGDEVQITVRNSAPTRAADIALGAGGSGLLGLRKRVELVAGTLRTGPLPDGGYELLAVLPAGASTTTTGDPA
ncbi:sensor histidine kinase [Embleya scabrispora]|uniref:sensor histidine kinase n=1 Tax=Embleya scabrispora TaxID=159449 RepID=UPI001FDF4ED8|nr:histidine kinase [Embleya scabrispora]